MMHLLVPSTVPNSLYIDQVGLKSVNLFLRYNIQRDEVVCTSNLILGVSEGQNRVALYIFLKLLLINLHSLSYRFRVNLNKIIPLVCEALVSHSNFNLHIDRRF